MFFLTGENIVAAMHTDATDLLPAGQNNRRISSPPTRSQLSLSGLFRMAQLQLGGNGDAKSIMPKPNMHKFGLLVHFISLDSCQLLVKPSPFFHDVTRHYG